MNNWSRRERLYQLLPAIYRIRDGAEGEPLRALLSVIESELETIEADIEALYDNWFIETCDPWVIPYIGDLVGNKPLHETVQPRRADVANTLYYRRRKATPAMLETLARDVTGWGAHVVEFFRLLAWTQHVNHNRYSMSANPMFGTIDTFAVREISEDETSPLTGRLDPNAVDRVGTVNLRNLDALDRLDGPFDEISHTVDMRPAGLTRDRYNLRKIGFFLWRLQSYAIEKVTPKPSTEATDGDTTYGYHVSPIGAQAPLFNHPRTNERRTGLVTEVQTPGPIRPLAIHRDLERCRIDIFRNEPCESDYVARDQDQWEDQSLSILKDNEAIPPEKIVVMDLKEWCRPPPEVRYRTAEGTEERQIEVGIDIQQGRMVFAEGKEPSDPAALKISYNYEFSADLGGGPYRRTQTVVRDVKARTLSVAGQEELDAALADWTDPTRTTRLNDLITIQNNGTYILSQNLRFRSGDRLVIQAADGNRPTLRIETDESGDELILESVGDEEDGGSLILGGLLIEGGLRVKGLLSQLEIVHSTLVPGRRLDEQGRPTDPGQPSITVDTDSHRLELAIDHSIVGRLIVPSEIRSLTVRDSIIDAPGENGYALAADDEGGFGPSTTLERVTVFGQVQVRQLALASEVIFTAPVTVLRRQIGCVRFSYVPAESITPRCYRCQPNREEVQGRLIPNFTSIRYGDPAYAQLGLTCPVQIRTGAEDGSEMGVFSSLRQPQREANLHQRLQEYLPFGLEPDLIFVT